MQYRIVIWVLRLGLPLLLVLGGVVFAAHRGAVRLMEPLHWYGEVGVEELSFDLAGKVHAKSISYRPFGAPENRTLVVRGVDITTPGLRWLVSAGLAADDPSPAEKRRSAAIKANHGGLATEPRALPPLQSLAGVAEAIEFGDTAWLPADLRWLGPATGSPYESLGCGAARRLDAETFETMGVPTGPLKGEFRLDAAGDRAKIEVRLYAEGRSSTAWSGDVRLADPTRLFDTDWQDMAIAAEQWLVTDESFVVARNRYCARLARVTRQGYVEVHAAAIAQELAKQGVGVAPEVMEVFKRFDTRGGELTLHSRPQAPLNRAAFRALPLDQQVQKLEASLSVNGEEAQPFRLVALNQDEAAQIIAESGSPGAAPESGGAAAVGAAQGKPASAPPAPVPPAASASPPAPKTSAPTVSTPVAASAVPSAAPPPSSKATPGTAGTGTGASPPSAPGIAPADTGPARTAAQAAPPEPAAGAPVPTKPPQVVVKLKPLPSVGRIRFDDLERAVGRVVAVDTRFGTRRVGKVVAYNRAAVTIEINEKGTSLPLTVPRGTVLAIELVSSESG